MSRGGSSMRRLEKIGATLMLALMQNDDSTTPGREAVVGRLLRDVFPVPKTDRIGCKKGWWCVNIKLRRGSCNDVS